MALQRVDAFRVAFDLEYASNLSDADWAAVVASRWTPAEALRAID